MRTKTRTKKERSASSLSEVADVYDVTLDTVKRWRADGMPGRPGMYVLREVSRWLRSEGPWKQHAKIPTIASEDPLLSDGDSPALERYRLAKAKHAELDLEHRKGELIEVDKAKDILGRWASLIRRMGEKLSKRYGNEAAIEINDTLGECRSAVAEIMNADA